MRTLFSENQQGSHNIIGRRISLRVQIIRRSKPSESANSFGNLSIQTVLGSTSCDLLLHFQRKKFSPDICSTSFLSIAAGIYTFQLQLFPKFEYFIMRLNLNRLCCGWKDQHQDFITTFESKTLIDIAVCNSTSQYTSKVTLDGGGEVSSSPAIYALLLSNEVNTIRNSYLLYFPFSPQEPLAGEQERTLLAWLFWRLSIHVTERD